MAPPGPGVDVVIDLGVVRRAMERRIGRLRSILGVRDAGFQQAVIDAERYLTSSRTPARDPVAESQYCGDLLSNLDEAVRRARVKQGLGEPTWKREKIEYADAAQREIDDLVKRSRARGKLREAEERRERAAEERAKRMTEALQNPGRANVGSARDVWVDAALRRSDLTPWMARQVELSRQEREDRRQDMLDSILYWQAANKGRRETVKIVPDLNDPPFDPADVAELAPKPKPAVVAPATTKGRDFRFDD